MTQPFQPGMFANTLAEVGAAPAAPYGQFTGYQPIPGVPNGYDFDLASGGKRKLVGPAAQELAGKLDAARGAAPVPGGAPPPNPNAFNPIAAAKGGGEIGVRVGGDPANPMDYVARTPGRAATKGGLALRAQTEQGGYELDPKRMAEIQESQDELQTTHKEAAMAARKAMVERQATFDAARAQASNEAAVMAHENAIKQQRIDALGAKYDAAEKDFLATPDKQKAARDGDKARKIVEALSTALGALGAGMARTPNFAAQIIDANRERDMRREEAELRVKKDVKDSLLGRLRDDMGSMELAKTAYRAIRTRQDSLMFEQQAAKTDDAQRAEQLTQIAAQQNQSYLKWLEQLERGKQGEVTKQLVNVPGQAGSRGGTRPLTIEELKGVQDLRKGEADIDKTRADAAKAATESSGGKLSDTAANTLSNVRTAKDLLVGVAKSSREAGYEFAPEGTVLGMSAQSKETIEHQAKARSLIRVAAKAVEGDSAAESHVAALEKSLVSGNPEVRRAAETELMRTLATKEREMTKVVPGAAGAKK